MSVRTVDVIEDALAYADFSNSDIEAALKKHIKQLSDDLDQVGYEPSTDTEISEVELEDALNEADEASEDLEAVLEDAAASGGVDDDEEDETDGDSDA